MVNAARVFLLSTALIGCTSRAAPVLNVAPDSPGDSFVPRASAQSFCPGERFSIKTPPLSSEPYVELTVGGRRGPFLIDYGATASSVEKGLLANGDGPVTLAGPELPGLPERNRFEVYDRNVVQQGVGDQLGVIGTDLLSKMVVEMRFENANDEHLVVSERCDTDGLGARGFWRFDQKGFFSANPVGQSRANVPVLYIDFQNGWSGNAIGTRTWAQIDPGYGDAVWPYSVDINDAYYAMLIAANLPLVEVASTTVEDCEKVARTDLVYVLPGHLLRIEAPDGAAMYRHSSVYLVRKGKGSGECGGIATIGEPAAQLGSSFLRVLGRMIFDPAREAVWILPTIFREQVPGTD
ncbi:hypothetical protein [Longimicrobium sp.]|uniref:hypothetical protein n=1 Tax=Longimicrobium sp. TaxID=2029185 RepID=UPI003B3A5B1B